MKVLISGASIAGPTLAHWLALSGHQVTVVERATALRPGGHAVDLRGPALEVITRMGLMDKCRAIETDTLYNECVDQRGKRFGRMKRGFGVIDPTDVEVMRGDLAQLLYEHTRDVADYRFGDHVLAIDGHDVAFASGRCESFDVIVGADGVHSRTRTLMFPGSELRHMGMAMAVFTVPDMLGIPRGQLVYNGVGKIGSIKSCGDQLKVVVFFRHAPGESIDLTTVADIYRNEGWVWPQICDAIDEADFYSDITCQIRGPIARDHVALVGDAGYCPSPLSGQGTSLAIAGAYCLAAELAGSVDVGAALARYEQRMLPFVRLNQDAALNIAKGAAPTSKTGLWMRNFMMRTLPYTPWAGLVMKLAMRGIRKAAHSLELPKYQLA
ncbi:MAG: FAD-dependent monooxygenase [Kofleriaceae bacterium]